jgi:N6-L-threonylcarbamoyladenine synthase
MFVITAVCSGILIGFHEMVKPLIDANKSFAFEQAVIDTLIHKIIKAAKKYPVKSILLAGGVSANKALRSQLKAEITKKLPNIKLFLPNLNYTTDNAAMIASAGYFNYYKNKNKAFIDLKQINAHCNLEM